MDSWKKCMKMHFILELTAMGFHVSKQEKITVHYSGHVVGDYYADLIVDNIIAIEIKAQDYLVEENEFQLINYLKATTIEVGLLLNFGKKPQLKRKIFDNDKKPMLKNKSVDPRFCKAKFNPFQSVRPVSSVCRV